MGCIRAGLAMQLKEVNNIICYSHIHCTGCQAVGSDYIMEREKQITKFSSYFLIH